MLDTKATNIDLAKHASFLNAYYAFYVTCDVAGVKKNQQTTKILNETHAELYIANPSSCILVLDASAMIQKKEFVACMAQYDRAVDALNSDKYKALLGALDQSASVRAYECATALRVSIVYTTFHNNDATFCKSIPIYKTTRGFPQMLDSGTKGRYIGIIYDTPLDGYASNVAWSEQPSQYCIQGKHLDLHAYRTSDVTLGMFTEKHHLYAYHTSRTKYPRLTAPKN